LAKWDVRRRQHFEPGEEETYHPQREDDRERASGPL
jgi:hypothetical protein